MGCHMEMMVITLCYPITTVQLAMMPLHSRSTDHLSIFSCDKTVARRVIGRSIYS